MKMKIVGALISALLISSFVPGRQMAAGEFKLPANCIGYAWTPNVEKAISDLSQFAEKLNIPNVSLMAFRTALGSLLENPDLSGVKMEGPFCLVFFKPSQYRNPWAICFQLSNPESYLKVLSRSLTEESRDEKTGTRTYRKEVETLDRQAFVKASPEEREDLKKFLITKKTMIILVVKEKTAWLSHNAEILNYFKDLTASDFPVPVEANLTLVFQIEPLLELIREKIDQSLPLIQSAASESPSPFGQEFSTKMIKSYFDFYLHYAQQVKTVTVGLTIDSQGISLEKLVEAERGSGLGEFLREQKGGNLNLARYLDPEAWMICAGNIQKAEMLLNPYSKLFDTFIPALGALPGIKEDIDLKQLKEAYLKSLKTYFSAVGDEFAFSISSSPDQIFHMIFLQKIKDEAAYRTYLREYYPETYQHWKPFYDEIGFTYDLSGMEEARKYQGAEIYTLKMKFDPEKMLKKGETGLKKRELLDSRLRKPMIMEMAIRKGLGIIRMSWGGKDGINSLLDIIAEGKSTFNRERLSACGDRVNGVIYFSLNQYFRWLSQLFTQFESSQPTKKGLSEFQKLSQLDLPLLFCFRVEGERLRSTTQIPIEKIQEFKQAVEQKPSP